MTLTGLDCTTKLSSLRVDELSSYLSHHNITFKGKNAEKVAMIKAHWQPCCTIPWSVNQARSQGLFPGLGAPPSQGKVPENEVGESTTAAPAKKRTATSDLITCRGWNWLAKWCRRSSCRVKPELILYRNISAVKIWTKTGTGREGQLY